MKKAATQAATRAGLPPEQARAVGEAATIAVMLTYLSASAPQARTPHTSESRDSAADAVSKDLEADAQWLGAVARAYATSPIVDEYRQHHHATQH